MNDTKHGENLEQYELKPEEIEDITGGQGGCPHPLQYKEGFDVYQIRPGDTLTKRKSPYTTL